MTKPSLIQMETLGCFRHILAFFQEFRAPHHHGALQLCQCPPGTRCAVCAQEAPITQTNAGTAPTRPKGDAPHWEHWGSAAAGGEGLEALGKVQEALR